LGFFSFLNIFNRKLPPELYTGHGCEKQIHENPLNVIQDSLLKTLGEDSDDPNSTSMIYQTLFTIYPKSDPRIVYKRHKTEGEWHMKSKFYANYLVNIANLIKNKDDKAQYEDVEKNKGFDIEGVTTQTGLQFNSLFESGNLYTAYKVIKVIILSLTL